MSNESEATLLLRIKAVGEEALDRAGSALAGLGKAAVAAYAVVSAAAAKTIHSFQEQEEATNSLNQVMINNGMYTSKLSDEYQKMASRLQSLTTYGDEQIISAQAQLQGYLGQTKVTEDLVKATLDLATAKKMDLASAADIVGKSIGTHTNALARNGIELDTTASKTEKMAQVIAGINGKWKDQSTAAAQNLGVLAQMKNAFSDIEESIGERLAPVVIAFARYMRDMAVEVQNNTQLMDGFVSVIHGFVSGGIVAKNIVLALSAALGQVLGTTVGAITQLIEGKFTMAWESVKSGFSGMIDDTKPKYQQMLDELDASDRAFASRKDVAREEEFVKIQNSNARKVAFRTEQNALELSAMQLQSEAEIIQDLTKEQLKTDVAYQALQNRIKNEGDHTVRLGLELQRRKMLEEAYAKTKRQILQQTSSIEEFLLTERVQKLEQGLNQMAQLQRSKSGAMVAIGKAAAIAQIGIDTARGAVAAFAAGMAIPFAGPILAPIFAGAMIAFGAERAASIAGIQLAEGGIVKARPGGIQATIGEGGRDEAVIPLDSAGGSSLLGRVEVHFHGPVMGDAGQAREFAVVLDKQLLELRRSNQSLAFESGII